MELTIPNYMRYTPLARFPIFASLILSVCSSSLQLQASEKNLPNFIIILADDLGYGDVGCFGHPTHKTPHIDAIANEGIKFTDFHSNGAVCSPTRAALMTGRYQQRTGITGVVTAARHRHTGLSPDELTIADVVKSAGYTTALYGKWHLGYDPKFHPIQQGFDEFIGFVAGNVDYHIKIDQTGREDWWKQDKLTPEEGYITDLISDHGVEFIKQNKDKPFFLYLAHGAPHYPYQGRSTPPLYTPGKGRDKSKDNPTRDVYKEMIEVMDEGVGRIRKVLDELDLSENTFIIFSADNGHSKIGSAGPLRGKKTSPYEGGHRVSTVASWPSKIKAGRVSSETLMLADLLPTFASMAGASIPEDHVLDGVDITPYLLDKKAIAPRDLFWGIGPYIVVRRGEHKVIFSTRKSDKVELYHLNEDLAESNNLASQKLELTQELVELGQQWHLEVTDGVEPLTATRASQ
ncbi:MAG: sulfatase-like hydrolase/transferase [Verrucomicrobiota bacterium]